MNDIGRLMLAFLGSIMTLAIISVFVSQRAATGELITDSGSALSSVIGAAESPVTGTGGTSSSSSGGFLSNITGSSGGSGLLGGLLGNSGSNPIGSLLGGGSGGAAF